MGQVETFVIKLKDNFTSPMKGADNQIDRTRQKFEGLRNTILTGFAAYAIKEFVSESVKAYDIQAKAEAQVQAGLASTAGVVGYGLDELKKKASELQKATLYGDEYILEQSTATLLTFTKIKGEMFDRAQQGVLDMSARMGVDLRSTAVQIGKVLQDPVKNLGALSRAGIVFSDAEAKVIKNLQETNRLGEAQAMILKEIETEFGGSAAAAAKAGSGGWQQLHNAFGDTREQLGEFVLEISQGLLPIMNKLNEIFSSSISFLSEHKFEVKTLGVTIGILAGGIGAIVVAAKAWTAAQWLLNFALTANPVGVLVVAIAALAALFYEAYQESEEFRAAIDTITDLFAPFIELVKDSIFWIEELFGSHDTSGVEGDFENMGSWIEEYVTNPLKDATDWLDKHLPESIVKAGDFLEEAFSFKFITDKYKENLHKQQMQINDEWGNFYIDKDGNKVHVSGASGSWVTDPGVQDRLGRGKKTEEAGGSDNNIKAGLSEIKSGAPKIFNIRVDSLIRDYIIKTNNFNEAVDKGREKATESMLSLLGDIQVIE